ATLPTQRRPSPHHRTRTARVGTIRASGRRTLGTLPGTEAGSWAAAERGGDELLGLAHERVQVRRAPEALRVDLVDALRARRPSREPPVRRHDLQPVDRRVVAGGTGQLGGARPA